jgi:hypothetical protein
MANTRNTTHVVVISEECVGRATSRSSRIAPIIERRENLSVASPRRDNTQLSAYIVWRLRACCILITGYVHLDKSCRCGKNGWEFSQAEKYHRARCVNTTPIVPRETRFKRDSSHFNAGYSDVINALTR